uniref:PKD_channel domain-containing protein n=1 Tax=Heterorhabditis bacteriophora TaxID=37862 RepID=A0A1I7WIL6_HETBA
MISIFFANVIFLGKVTYFQSIYTEYTPPLLLNHQMRSSNQELNQSTNLINSPHQQIYPLAFGFNPFSTGLGGTSIPASSSISWGYPYPIPLSFVPPGTKPISLQNSNNAMPDSVCVFPLATNNTEAQMTYWKQPVFPDTLYPNTTDIPPNRSISVSENEYEGSHYDSLGVSNNTLGEQIKEKSSSCGTKISEHSNSYELDVNEPNHCCNEKKQTTHEVDNDEIKEKEKVKRQQMLAEALEKAKTEAEVMRKARLYHHVLKAADGSPELEKKYLGVDSETVHKIQHECMSHSQTTNFTYEEGYSCSEKHTASVAACVSRGKSSIIRNGIEMPTTHITNSHLSEGEHSCCEKQTSSLHICTFNNSFTTPGNSVQIILFLFVYKCNILIIIEFFGGFVVFLIDHTVSADKKYYIDNKHIVFIADQGIKVRLEKDLRESHLLKLRHRVKCAVVTGGDGTIGREVVKRLLHLHFNVHALVGDRNKAKKIFKPWLLKEKDNKLQLYNVDLSDPYSVPLHYKHASWSCTWYFVSKYKPVAQIYYLSNLTVIFEKDISCFFHNREVSMLDFYSAMPTGCKPITRKCRQMNYILNLASILSIQCDIQCLECFPNEIRLKKKESLMLNIVFQIFEEISSIKDIWDYLEKVFVPGLNWNKMERNLKQKGLVYYRNKLLGKPRIRIVKVTNNSCDGSNRFIHNMTTCFGQYQGDKEDKSSFIIQEQETTKDWFQHKNINRIDGPYKSPDPNPMNNLGNTSSSSLCPQYTVFVDSGPEEDYFRRVEQ